MCACSCSVNSCDCLMSYHLLFRVVTSVVVVAVVVVVVNFMIFDVLGFVDFTRQYYIFGVSRAFHTNECKFLVSFTCTNYIPRMGL